MHKYVQEQTATLLRRLASSAHEAAALGTSDAVHDLRVGIRRLNQCLQLFAASFPKDKVRKIRRELKKVMDLAGEVRDLDITIELCKKAKIRVDPLVAHERRRARKQLISALKSWTRHDFSQRSRERLNV